MTVNCFKKNFGVVLSAFLFVFLVLSTWAQSQEEPGLLQKYNPIFEELAKHHPDQGFVQIYQPEQIARLVGKVRSTQKVVQGTKAQQTITESGKLVTKRWGYRIQIYTGNLPNSKDEAYHRARLVANLFPTESTYVVYNAPFWRLVVGNYRTREEAHENLIRFKTALPNISSEIYIVKDRVLLP